MKHRVVWIDDSHTWVRSVREELEDCFSEKGFDIDLIHRESYDDAKPDIHENYVDLILLDYGLPGLKGDDIIKELRKSRCFAQIVFYSQESERLACQEGDDHFLHVVERDKIDGTLEILADQAYRKYHHPFFMRGLLLSEFIDLENCLDRVVSNLFGDHSDFFHEYMVYKSGEAFSFSAKAKFLHRVLRDIKKDKPETVAKLDEIGFANNSFLERIIKNRNVLAHAHPEFVEDSSKIQLRSSISDVVFDGEWFHSIRETIYGYKKVFGQLEDLDLQDLAN